MFSFKIASGIYVVVMSLDRLSRNKGHIKTELEYFKEHHIRVKILDIATTLIDLPEEQERMRTLQRQAQGIAAAKEKGKHLGRPKADYPETGMMFMGGGSGEKSPQRTPWHSSE